MESARFGIIRRNIYDIMRAEARREQPKRVKDVEL